jgi:hypothetical protein
MPTDPSPETWAQIRYEYEHTDKPVEDICFDHRVSQTTLRDRVRRWGWSKRRQPIWAEGPPPLPVGSAPPLGGTMTPAVMPPPVMAPPAAPLAGPDAAPSVLGAPAAAPAAPHAPAGEPAPSDPAEVAPRLQAAVARVLPAIEATLAKLAAAPMPPREMERAARTLTSLTRTLRELNELLSEHQARGACHCECEDTPEDIDAFRLDLARRIDAFVASHASEQDGPPGSRPPADFVPYGG